MGGQLLVVPVVGIDISSPGQSERVREQDVRGPGDDAPGTINFIRRPGGRTAQQPDELVVLQLPRPEQRTSRIVRELHPAPGFDHGQRCHFQILERSPQALALKSRAAKLAELAQAK